MCDYGVKKAIFRNFDNCLCVSRLCCYCLWIWYCRWCGRGFPALRNGAFGFPVKPLSCIRSGFPAVR